MSLYAFIAGIFHKVYIHTLMFIVGNGVNLEHKYYVSEQYPSSCFHLKHNVSKTAFCLCLQVTPVQLGPINRASRDRDELYQLGPTE
jgi:hypothetical protein